MLLRPALLSLALSAAPDTAQVDLNRYLGRWYEIARFDHFFERGCTAATQDVSRREDGNLKIENKCRKGSLDGKPSGATAKAWAPDPAVPGKLKIQFFWPFFSDFWILEVSPDYAYAALGGESRKQAWVMSRTPTMPHDVYAGIVERLRARGYDTSKLLKVDQVAPSSASDAGPQK